MGPASQFQSHLRRAHPARLHDPGRCLRHADRPPPARCPPRRRLTTARDAMSIPTSRVRRRDTHRFIQSKYSPKEDSVLTRIADDAGHLTHLFEFDNATNDRLLAERELLPGISAQELVTGIPYA